MPITEAVISPAVARKFISSSLLDISGSGAAEYIFVSDRTCKVRNVNIVYVTASAGATEHSTILVGALSDDNEYVTYTTTTAAGARAAGDLVSVRNADLTLDNTTLTADDPLVVTFDQATDNTSTMLVTVEVEVLSDGVEKYENRPEVF